MTFIKRVPLAIGGLALSLAATGNLLFPYGEWVRVVCDSLSAALLTLLFLRIALDFKAVCAELRHPAALSVMPTASQALMVLSAYVHSQLHPQLNTIAHVIWYLAVAAQLALMALFAARFVRGFKLENVYPGWFVAFTGIVTVSVTAPVMDALPLGQTALIAGLILYPIALLLVVWRMVKLGPLPGPLRPTIATFTAPLSLSIVGYFLAFEQQNVTLLTILAICAVACYLYVTANMPKLLRLKFYPSCSAFTFPYVISATAFKWLNGFLIERGYRFFQPVQKVSEWIAVALVLYVLVRYLLLIATPPSCE